MDHLKTWALPAAILLAGTMAAGSLIFGHRYSTISVANVLWVTDRMTGQVTQCAYPTTLDGGGVAACKKLWPIRPLTDAEVGLKPGADLSAWSKPSPDINPFAGLGTKK